jgi:hypothetical protein
MTDRAQPVRSVRPPAYFRRLAEEELVARSDQGADEASSRSGLFIAQAVQRI